MNKSLSYSNDKDIKQKLNLYICSCDKKKKEEVKQYEGAGFARVGWSVCQDSARKGREEEEEKVEQ